LLYALQAKVDERECEYVDLRPIRDWSLASAGFCERDAYYLHTIDLERDLRTVYLQFHKDCVQRKIRRAERERLTCSEGRSEAFIEQYYRLLLLTVERHHAPPQPISWFRNLATCLGESMKVRIASKDGQPVAGVITLTYNRKMIYKYAASDAKYQSCGGNALLLWTSIQEAKNRQMHQLDMGRSDIRHTGLIAFKEHWGAQRSTLNYWRYPARLMIESRRWAVRSGEVLLRYAPKQVLRLAGSLMYKHMA
jgi:lipid II:glycine glycyltransferase (peptidoglycan interpeptide bridge formation enzyme)